MSDERSTNSVDKALGLRVRARRLALGMSQERLADALGVTFQQVQKYEKGLNRIAASRLFAISEVLKLPIADFFHGLGGRKGSAGANPSEHVLATPEGAQLVSAFADIKNARVRVKAVAMLRALADGD